MARGRAVRAVSERERERREREEREKREREDLSWQRSHACVAIVERPGTEKNQYCR